MGRILLVLGAGASYDCANESSVVNGDWKPPLASELFRISEKDAFEDILIQYPGAQYLAGELSPSSSENEFDLERKLQDLVGHQDKSIRDKFGDVPRYLSHLLDTVSTEYTKTAGWYCALCKALMSDHGHRLSVISLNYDTLFESAVALHFNNPRYYSDIKAFARQGMECQLFKVHGSSNWWFDVGRGAAMRDTFHSTFQDHCDDWVNRILVLSRSQLQGMHQIDATRLVPVITAPLASKGEGSFVIPGYQVSALMDSIQDADAVMFVGTSGMDSHVLDFIRGSLQRAVPGCFIGHGTGAEPARSRVAKAMGDSLSSLELHDCGFGEALRQRRVHTFAAGVRR